MSDDNWEYLPVLNVCLQILSTVGLGAVLGKFGVFDMNFVGHAVKFVFHVALPCLVVKGIGVGVDFYSDNNIWRFISAFLILRVIALLMAFASLLLNRDRSQVGIGDVAVRWLSLSWISTIILGYPIMSKVMDPRRGLLYGLLAGISSFIFQLPLQLCFLECHAVEKIIANSSPDTSHNESAPSVDTPEEEGVVSPTKSIDADLEDVILDEAISAEEGHGFPTSKASTEDHSGEVAVKSPPANRWALAVSYSTSKEMWRKIGLRILMNPILWGIFWGFVISLSTFGVKFLRPMDTEQKPPQPNPDYKEWLQFIVDALTWLGETTPPVSLFAMGVWMQDQGRQLFKLGILQLSLFMLSKLVLVPLIMVGLSLALGLSDEAGRAAVLIGTLPISMASFSLGKQYNIGENVLSANVAVGTMLMLPTVLIWNAVMDQIDLFTDF